MKLGQLERQHLNGLFQLIARVLELGKGLHQFRTELPSEAVLELVHNRRQFASVLITAPLSLGPEFDPQRANVWNGENHHKNTLEDGFRFTSPARSFPANALGLYDVIGNIFEYCSGFSATRSYGETNNLISGRGGSWWCSAGTCNSFNLVTIGAMDIHGSLCNQGFRIVVEVNSGVEQPLR